MKARAMRAMRATRSIGALAVALLVALLVVLAPAPARAHHVPGHGASEGVRNINSLGNSGGRAMSRLLLLNELIFANQGLSPNISNQTSLYAEYAPIPALSIAAQAPLLVVHDLTGSSPDQIGYGDTRIQLRVTPHARKLIHRIFSVGLTASLPTRTVRFLVDPGNIVIVSPFAVFTRTYARHFWQVIGLSTIEHRPAGTAVELSVGAQGGSKLLDDKMTLGLGVLVDLRAANFCAQPRGGESFCRESRASEIEREVGTLRAVILATISYNIRPRWSVIGALQGPITPRLDFTVGASLGTQVFF